MPRPDAARPDLDKVVIRRLRPDDLESVVAIDAKLIGRRRDEYFQLKLKMAMNETGIEVSLAAELDGGLIMLAEAGGLHAGLVTDPLRLSGSIRPWHSR